MKRLFDKVPWLQQIGCGVLVCALLLSICPVSYTHLDVYKRQPLYNNYFVALNGLSTSLNGLVPPLTGLNLESFGSYAAKTDASAAKLTLKGVKLVPPKNNNANSTAPDDFLFGYADCHPNGLRSNVQLNPYTTGRTSNTTSNGDPMDLSWAVNKDGSVSYTHLDVYKRQELHRCDRLWRELHLRFRVRRDAA